jgi:hypothetical protein
LIKERVTLREHYFNCKTSFMKKLILLTTTFFFLYSVKAQWTTSGNEIVNTGTTTGLCVNPLGPGRIILGPSNTGIGGYTSLSLNISAYQDGYASIQSIKASGCCYGVLALNESGGGVGIGTANPGTFKLAVEGKIGAREIQVTLQNPWPDYVFNKNYRLRSISGLEKYIQQYNHLPGLPSAEEVSKNNGVELGAMNAKLVEKVEELTLYIIELNKKIEKLEAEHKKSCDSGSK